MNSQITELLDLLVDVAIKELNKTNERERACQPQLMQDIRQTNKDQRQSTTNSGTAKGWPQRRT